MYPALALQYRYYYNAARRKAKGKRTEMNSLNYVSALVETRFLQGKCFIQWMKNNFVPQKYFGVVWGFQRKLSENDLV
jgi:hypothetical protein